MRQAALIFLYRLLFVLYAEDRGLLPVNDTRYDDYGLRKPVRDDVADRMASGGDTFSDKVARFYNHLMSLFNQIDEGDASIGLPPYNGGLFAPDAAPLLESVRLGDAVIASIVYDLSHAEMDGERRFVNYRDMSVQQLGSIYERLLEQEPVRDDVRRDRHSSEPVRAQGQRELLHAAGAGGPDSGPDAEAAGRGAAVGVREEGDEAQSGLQAEWSSGWRSW